MKTIFSLFLIAILKLFYGYFKAVLLNISGKAAILWNPILTSSYWDPLRSGTCSHDAKEWYENLSDMWQFTFKIEAAQRRSVVKTAPKLPIPLWTEALSDMVFVSAHKLSGIV